MTLDILAILSIIGAFVGLMMYFYVLIGGKTVDRIPVRRFYITDEAIAKGGKTVKREENE